MTGHTPGPWSVCDDGVSVYQPEQDTLISTYGGDASLWGLDDETMRANARLISAAPDLLEACRRALVSLEDYNTGDEGYDVWSAGQNPALAILRAAITKATGETT